jgi:hypothetical protein
MNVQHEIKDNKLVLTVDVSPAAIEKSEPSKSGKSKMVGTTNGFVKVGPVSVSLNVIAR